MPIRNFCLRPKIVRNQFKFDKLYATFLYNVDIVYCINGLTLAEYYKRARLNMANYISYFHYDLICICKGTVTAGTHSLILRDRYPGRATSTFS